jgi:hypothetical protein
LLRFHRLASSVDCQVKMFGILLLSLGLSGNNKRHLSKL